MSRPRNKLAQAISNAVTTDDAMDRTRNVFLCRLRGMLRRGKNVYLVRKVGGKTIVTRNRKRAMLFAKKNAVPLRQIHIPSSRNPTHWEYGYDWIPLGPRGSDFRKRCGPPGSEINLYHFEPIAT